MVSSAKNDSTLYPVTSRENIVRTVALYSTQNGPVKATFRSSRSSSVTGLFARSLSHSPSVRTLTFFFSSFLLSFSLSPSLARSLARSLAFPSGVRTALWPSKGPLPTDTDRREEAEGEKLGKERDGSQSTDWEGERGKDGTCSVLTSATDRQEGKHQSEIKKGHFEDDSVVKGLKGRREGERRGGPGRKQGRAINKCSTVAISRDMADKV